MNSKVQSELKHSKRCYHWLLVWAAIIITLIIGIAIRGFIPRGASVLVVSITLVLGYMFFIDVSERIHWTADQIVSQGWDYLSIKPVSHSVRIEELTKVLAASHPANWQPGRPFDRISLVSPADTITILPSFYRREELEELLHLAHSRRPGAFLDPNVREFIAGRFTDWWPYR